MNSSRLILAFFLVFSSLVGAMDKIDRRENIDKFKKYKLRVEEQIDDLPGLTNCDNKPSDPEKIQCVKDALNDLSQADIDKIDQAMELKTHRLIKSRKKQDVVKYLMSELEKKIHGKQSDSNRKNRKHISQADYFTLHKNRLTKNSLLETSSFCRERVHITRACVNNRNQKCTISTTKPDINDTSNFAIHVGIKNATELQATNDELADPIGDRTVAAVKYDICIQNISALCNAYKQNLSDSSYKQFHEACLFKERIAKFKSTLNKTVEIERELLNSRTQTGYAVESTYAGRFDRKKIDDITNITSDITKDDKFKNTPDLDDFKDKCEVGKTTPECSQYVDTMSQEEFDKISFELKKKNLIQKGLIDKLSEEDLKKFARRYMTEKETQEAGIKQKLRDEFDAQKAAIIENIKNQLHAKEIIAEEKQEKDFKFEKNDKAEKVFADVKAIVEEKAENPNAMRDNIFYSNMVNSYLERYNAKTKVTSSNFAFGEAEFKTQADQSDQTYFAQRTAAKKVFDQQQKSSQKRGVASSEKGEGISGITGLFDIIMFGETSQPNQ